MYQGNPKSQNGGTVEWWKMTPNPKTWNNRKWPQILKHGTVENDYFCTINSHFCRFVCLIRAFFMRLYSLGNWAYCIAFLLKLLIMLQCSFLAWLKNGMCKSVIFWHFDVYWLSFLFYPSSSFLLANDWKKWGKIQGKSGLVQVSRGFEFIRFELVGFCWSGSTLTMQIKRIDEIASFSSRKFISTTDLYAVNFIIG